jgi:hypothetical protein
MAREEHGVHPIARTLGQEADHPPHRHTKDINLYKSHEWPHWALQRSTVTTRSDGTGRTPPTICSWPACVVEINAAEQWNPLSKTSSPGTKYLAPCARTSGRAMLRAIPAIRRSCGPLRGMWDKGAPGNERNWSRCSKFSSSLHTFGYVICCMDNKVIRTQAVSSELVAPLDCRRRWPTDVIFSQDSIHCYAMSLISLSVGACRAPPTICRCRIATICRAVKFSDPSEVLTPEDAGTWCECKGKLINLGLEESDAERVLQESFGWTGNSFWGSEKVRINLMHCTV